MFVRTIQEIVAQNGHPAENIQGVIEKEYDE
jgi:hypothetical protein